MQQRMTAGRIIGHKLSCPAARWTGSFKLRFSVHQLCSGDIDIFTALPKTEA